MRSKRDDSNRLLPFPGSQRQPGTAMTSLSAACFLLQLLLCICAVTAQPSREHVTNNSQDDSESSRIRIHSFQLVLAETSTPITATQEPELQEIVETLLSDAVLRRPLPHGTSLSYLLLRDIEKNIFSGGRVRKLFSSSIIEFGGGIASFTGDGAPSKAELEAWIAESLEDDLPTSLRSAPSQSFPDVTSATYISLTARPTPATSPTPSSGIERGDSLVDDKLNIPLITGVAAAVFVALVGAIVFLLVLRRRRRVSSGASHSSVKEDTTKLDSSYHAGDHNNLSMDESIDGSEFTLSTTDHTIRSMASRRYTPRNDLYKVESFEYDRKVSLHKDTLLVSPAWAMESPANPHETHSTNNDSVLEPSHFVSENEYDLDSRVTADEADGDNTDSPFLFQGGEGEEVYLMSAPGARSRNEAKLVSYDLERIDENVADPAEL